jgi:hypothetical protein
MIRTLRWPAGVLAVAVLLAPTAWAGDIGIDHVMKGNVLKYSQPIGHLTPLGTDMHTWGEDIPSDVDWHRIMEPSTQPLPPNWIIADDFRDPFDTPVLTVRWWGSYVGPTFGPGPEGPMPIFGPGSEDGYLISFFKDIPADPDGGIPFSMPGELLGSYAVSFDKVWVEPTPYIGWDQEEIYEYKANLMDAHLDHASDLAGPMGFNQRAGEIYWISIVAEVGHKLSLVEDATGNVVWVEEPTGKMAMPNPENEEGHYWGWHTSPIRFNDIATMGHLIMPGNEWQYFNWQPIQPKHELLDMAFELYTVPEPASALLIGLVLVAAGGLRLRFV